MSDRVNNLASASAVAVAVVGSAAHDLALSLLGPLLALAVHVWGEYRADRRTRNNATLVEHLKLRNFELEQQLGASRTRGPGPPNQ
jgi:hypothetical protein